MPFLTTRDISGIIAATEAAGLVVLCFALFLIAKTLGSVRSLLFGPPLPPIQTILTIWVIALASTFAGFASIPSFTLALFVAALLHVAASIALQTIPAVLFASFATVFLARYILRAQF